MAAGGYFLYNAHMDSNDEDDSDDQDYGVDYGTELEETRALMRELEAEASEDPLVAAIERPVDGTYTGFTAEDDDGDQDARTTLKFGKDGGVTGTGIDGVDGPYRIRTGRWSPVTKRVAWLEEYDQGFTVALRGQLLPDGSIRAMWASSLDIGGSVTLEAP